MGPHGFAIVEERELRLDERSLVRWLLEHGLPGARDFLPQAERARLISRCGCGCASLNLVIDGKGWPSPGGMEILSEYQWGDPEGHLFGIFLFAKESTLAGVDVYSVDGLAVPVSLPRPDDLRSE